MNKRAAGALKEEQAAAFLEECGYEIVERNFYSRYGEIDIICRKDGYLVFVEVKYRKAAEFGFPSEAVTRRKCRAMMATARYYLYKKGLGEETPCRFDLVSILGNQMEVIENCLEGQV